MELWLSCNDLPQATQAVSDKASDLDCKEQLKEALLSKSRRVESGDRKASVEPLTC